MIHHLVQAVHFIGVAINGVLLLFFGVSTKMSGLPEHRPDATHLKHQPLQRGVFRSGFVGQKLAGFLRQINQNRTGFIQGEWPVAGAVTINDCRNFIVWVDLQELRFELIARARVNRMHSIRQAGFFQHDMNFAAIGRGPSVQVYRKLSF